MASPKEGSRVCVSCGCPEEDRVERHQNYQDSTGREASCSSKKLQQSLGGGQQSPGLSPSGSDRPSAQPSQWWTGSVRLDPALRRCPGLLSRPRGPSGTQLSLCCPLPCPQGQPPLVQERYLSGHSQGPVPTPRGRPSPLLWPRLGPLSPSWAVCGGGPQAGCFVQTSGFI